MQMNHIHHVVVSRCSQKKPETKTLSATEREREGEIENRKSALLIGWMDGCFADKFTSFSVLCRPSFVTTMLYKN